MNVLGYSLTLSSSGGSVDLFDDEELVITAATGFDLKGDLSLKDLSPSDGSEYQYGRLPERDIGLTIRYKDVPDAEAAKLRLHAVCVPKQQITITQITPNLHRYICGYIKKCDSPPHTYPMTTSIEIVCPDPCWQLVSTTTQFQNGVDLPASFTYEGQIDVGCRLEITMDSDVTDLTISTNKGSVRFYPGRVANAGWFDSLNHKEFGPPTFEPIYETDNSGNTVKDEDGNPVQTGERIVDMGQTYYPTGSVLTVDTSVKPVVVKLSRGSSTLLIGPYNRRGDLVPSSNVVMPRVYPGGNSISVSAGTGKVYFNQKAW